VGAPGRATTISPTSSTPRSASGPPMPRPLPIAVEELAAILEGDPVHGGGRIDLRTGEVWPQAAVDYAREQDREDPTTRTPTAGSPCGARAPSRGSRTGTGPIGCRSSCRAGGPSAASRTSSSTGPGELEAWYAFSSERQRGRVRAWLAAAGYSPRPAGVVEIVTAGVTAEDDLLAIAAAVEISSEHPPRPGRGRRRRGSRPRDP
jgi:hypothetical protein